MRCQKCQYVGFEPSPRCKNCGYDFSLSNSDNEADFDRPGDDAPMADFDLQIFDQVPVKRVQGGAKPFDLDDLLANGPASGSLSGMSDRESAPVIERVSAVARHRQSSASASASASASTSAPSSSFASSSSSAASAVATPPPMAIEALYKAEPVVMAVEPEPVPEPAVAMSPPPPPRARPAAPAPVTTELPLFMQGMSAPVVHAPAPVPVPVPVPASAHVDAAADAADQLYPDAAHQVDDRPLVQMPATPRAPLAVRRTTPDPARLRGKYGRAAARVKADPIETSGDLLYGANQPEMSADSRIVPPAQRLSSEPTPTSLPAEWIQGVGPAKRLLAAALDSALLLGLNAAVIWFTLSVCGLAPAQANLLPVAPLLLFFLLLDAGYLVLFTAACGQTIGKMAAGIRVVGTTTGAVINDRITIAQAVMRSLGSIVSMLPLGAGFWFGLVGDRRAVHDRLAHTRVVAA